VRLLDALEQANVPICPPDHLWRRLISKARTRDDLAGRSWPGSVFVPSSIIREGIACGRLLLPSSWRRLDRTQSSILFALLAAWQLDRGIYEFRDMARVLVGNTHVRVPLSARDFRGLPSYAIYVALSPNEGSTEGSSLPHGFLAGIDCGTDGVERLAVALDYESRLEVKAFAFSGQTPDEMLGAILAEHRLQDAQQRRDSAARLVMHMDQLLHVVLSAILMACAHHNDAQVVEDGGSAERTPGSRPRWTRWRIGEGIETTLTQQIGRLRASRVVLEPSKPSPMGAAGDRQIILGEWRVSPSTGLPQLVCNLGRGYRFSGSVESHRPDASGVSKI
jgi:hypothetical protein